MAAPDTAFPLVSGVIDISPRGLDEAARLGRFGSWKYQIEAKTIEPASTTVAPSMNEKRERLMVTGEFAFVSTAAEDSEPLTSALRCVAGLASRVVVRSPLPFGTSITRTSGVKR